MINRPGGRVLCAAAAVCTVLSAAGPAAAGASGTAAVEWSAAHGTSVASGTRWTEPSGTGFGAALVVEGELRNSGTECFSVWVRWTYDFVPGPYRKHATQCGTGTAPVSVRLDPYRPTTTGQLTVCRGSADTRDCGPAVSLTSWPVRG
ncbi:hypothetical protein N4P33_09795 [Streptomyces sp. 15-116A]|uniref:hypothetical protein n=1 Tax=Streptomyces sp. 15-116A TaxID=2259035 RepID=UPI0021B3AA5A|nr:hypothetical protein [Streptomyces sp. 15-116A]MCT7352467.1 hypothetical protein [Streptomyces sp. 15-116A]